MRQRETFDWNKNLSFELGVTKFGRVSWID
jgi:hypothetical protein